MLRVMNSCKMCGKCCYYEIPVTLLDIHRISMNLSVAEKTVFQKFIQDKISSRSVLFMIQKNEQGGCIFLSNDQKCSIHETKPKACEFYLCSLSSDQENIPWTAYCTTHKCQVRLWEHSLSATVTKSYIERNGTRWNETDYHNAISSILKNIGDDDNKRIKLSRDSNGVPMVMVYDCSECESRGTVACETPITLDDIRRISLHLKIRIKDFFQQKVSSEMSQFTKGLMLIRDKHCIFFNQKIHCLIKDVRPMHCRFVPCPKRAKSTEMQERFYLGSGTIEEQFRHQVALELTRQYVIKSGTKYNERIFNKLLGKIDKIISHSSELEKFCKKIAPYRYVDDTITIPEPHQQSAEHG